MYVVIRFREIGYISGKSKNQLFVYNFVIFFPANVERAKIALNEKVGELEQEEADKALKSFEVKIDVKPEYHPKLIGRGGQVIKQLRSDFDVNIQLPTKGNENDESTIIITGYEKNANEAKDAILKIIGDFVSKNLKFKKTLFFVEGNLKK